jgi:hypothetical protein
MKNQQIMGTIPSLLKAINKQEKKLNIHWDLEIIHGISE